MTTKAAHTPGPWREFSPFIFNKKPFKISEESYRTLKAGNGYYDWRDPEAGFGLTGFISPGNARLISATPEILEALDNLIQQISIREDAGERFHIDIRTACAKGEAAIQKARGLDSHEQTEQLGRGPIPSGLSSETER